MLKRQTMTRKLACLTALCAVMLCAMPRQADSLQREGFPLIDNVTLVGVSDGKLQYRTAAGDREVGLEEVATLSIQSVPQFATGLAAFKDGEMRAAQRAFGDVWSGTRVPWIRHYAGFYLIQAHDRRNQPVEAAQIFAQIAAENADLFFLSKPPIASLAQANNNEKQRIGDQIMAVVRQSEGERRRLLRAFHRLVVGEDAPLPEIEDGPVAQDSTQKIKAQSKLLLPDGVWNMLDRRGEPEGKWDAIKLLAQGDAQGALESIKPWLSNPGDLPEKLFIRGKAQLVLAEQANDRDLYRDAGLTFMRIVIHFTRQGRPHPLVAPANLEVAYIHKQIDREDIYERILFGGEGGGGVHLLIDDAQAYPEYRKRYYQIIEQEIPEDDQP